MKEPVSTTINLDQMSVDLRQPKFSKVRKGSWLIRITILYLVDFILLFLVWMSVKRLVYLWDRADAFPEILIFISIQILFLAIQGNYQSGRKRIDFFNIFKSLFFSLGAVIFIFISFHDHHTLDFDPSILILCWLASAFFVCVGRLTLDILLNHLRGKRILGCVPAFVICEPENSEKYIAIIEKEKRYIVQAVDVSEALDRDYRKSTLDRLNKLNITEVFVSWDSIKNRMFLRWIFQSCGITLHILPMQTELFSKNLELERIGEIACLSFECPMLTGKDFWIKRILDFNAAVLFIVLTFPIYLAIAIAIKLDSPGPVFYRQTRIGLHEQEFRIWKFRTMRNDADKMQKTLETLNETKDGILFKIKNDPRVTLVGKFLRRYSLDELPQIFNVLRGQMSLVGPRPLPVRDVNKFSERHFIRHEILPGITGLWQISGRSDILDFEQVIKLDLDYIENWSLLLDLKILIKTVQIVLNKKGAY